MSALTNVDDADRAALALGARALQQLGHEASAVVVDKMARQAAAVLRNQESINGIPRWRREGLKTWRDMPTCLLREPRL